MINILKESFSSSFPDWLVKALETNSNNSYKNNRPKRRWDDIENGDVHIAWDKAEYIPAKLPTSARAKEYKDPNRLQVFRIKTYENSKGEYKLDVYIPHMLVPEVDTSMFNKDNWNYVKANRLSYEKLASITVEYGYILLDANSTVQQRADRKNARSGGIYREPNKGQHLGKEYGSDQLTWRGPDRGYDKSGYKLDPNKYTRMLADMDVNNTKAAQRRVEELYNQIEKVRVDAVQQLQASSKELYNQNPVDSWSNSRLEELSDAIKYVSKAMREYESLLKSIESLADVKGKPDQEAYKRWVSMDLQRCSAECKDCISRARKILDTKPTLKDKQI